MSLPPLGERVRNQIKKIQQRQQPAAGQDPPPTPAEAGPPRQAYYDSARKTFWVRNVRGEWMEVTEGSLRRYLRSRGISALEFLPNGLSKLDGALLAVQHEHDVHYAGPLAGYQVGAHEVAGNRVLVTRGAKRIAAAKGDSCTVEQFLRQLLPQQIPWFWGWLRAAFDANDAGAPYRAGQMLAVAGPPGCGKSLLQGLITELLGGRVAKPYRYLIGDTAFNSELFAAEHLAIEDEAASTDMRTRRTFGQQLKNLIVNDTQSFHCKGRPALSLSPFWRVSITLNDEPESLMVLPPMTDDLRDKIILLKAAAAKLPFGADDLAGRKAFREQLSRELPAFLHHLRRWRIPPDLQDQRYGVAAWQNPDLMERLAELAPEVRLLALIDSLWLFGDSELWEGSSMDLETQLRERDKTGEVGRLLAWNNAAGVFLGRLAKLRPERVSTKKHGGHKQSWCVQKP